MDDGFWHFKQNFVQKPAFQVLEGLLGDDDRNRQRSSETFRKEQSLVDEGLALYIQALQGGFREHEHWEGNKQLRASLAMLVHALNAFLAWRHLTSLGYLAETRLFARNIHESLSQALAFAVDEDLADKFLDGKQISTKGVRRRLARAFAGDKTSETDVYRQFEKTYVSLSKRAHPTLDSLSSRTLRARLGPAALAESMPLGVLMGGLLSDELGRVTCAGLAKKSQRRSPPFARY